MSLLARTRAAGRVFLDTAPVVYYVEGHPRFIGMLTELFDAIDGGEVAAVTSPITLAECLVQPHRTGRTDLIGAFTERVLRGANTQFLQLDAPSALAAAQLRARYNLTLTDAVQVALAGESGCSVLLTNDLGLRRVREIEVLVLDDYLERELPTKQT